MKQNTMQKPRFFRYFLRKLIPCSISAALLGGLGTGTLYLLRTQAVTEESRDAYTRITTELTDKDISECSEKEISFLMARRTMNDRSYSHVDRAYLLKRLDTAETYDTQEVAFSIYRENGEKHTCYCFDPDVIGFINQKNHSEMLDEGYYLRIQDIYVNGESFLPGKMDYIYECMGEEKLIDTYDLTPEDTSGYRRIERTNDPEQDGVRTVYVLGSATNSEALELVRRLPDDQNDIAYVSPHDYDALMLQNYGTLYLFQGGQEGGIPCILKSATCYDFWGEMHLVLLILYGILLAAALLIAGLWGLFSWLGAKKAFEMAEYRRTLTNALAHDLKSPLMAISGCAENLKSGVKQEKQAYYTDAILQNTQYMDNMITNVLELSRLEGMRSTDKTDTDAARLLQEAFAQYAPLLEERDITLTAQGDCPVHANPKMLAQAMANLAANAVKYTPDGGSIRIHGEAGRLTVENTCTGDVPEQPLAPFTKGKAARTGRDGCGLGLAIVEQIMGLHGFKVAVKAENAMFVVEMLFKK